MTEQAELLVIGAGAAGVQAARTAAGLGVQVTVVSAGEIGGTCVNSGCVPSNALLHAAQAYDRDGAGAAGFDLAGAHRAAAKVVSRVRGSVRHGLAAAGVRIIEGRATLRAPGTVSIQAPGGEFLLQASKTIIATGATTILPPAAQAGQAGQAGQHRVLTSAGALALQQIPRSAIVVLGGHLGLEWATFLRHAGSDVTVIEEFATLRGVGDAEVAEYFSSLLEARGIAVLTGCRVASVEPSPGDVTITAEGPSGQSRHRAQLALFADFRRANSAGLGLADAGIDTDAQAAIVVDASLRTKAPAIWAAGDVTGGLMLAADAQIEGAVAAENACGAASILDRRFVPRALHTDPEAASVGLTEAQARASGADVITGYAEYAGSVRALILGADQGVVKLICDAATEEILGAAIVGAGAIELASLLSLAMRAELTVSELSRSSHAHPAMSELIAEASRAVLASAIQG